MPGTLRRFNSTYGKTGRKLFTLCCYTLEVITLTEIMKLGIGKLGNRKNARSALIIYVPTSTLKRPQRTKVSLPPHTEGYCAAFDFLRRENQSFLKSLNLLNDTFLIACAIFLQRLKRKKKLQLSVSRPIWEKDMSYLLLCLRTLRQWEYTVVHLRIYAGVLTLRTAHIASSSQNLFPYFG